MGKTMYEITQDFSALRGLLNSLEDEDGNPREPTPEEAKALISWYEENNADFETKADNICKFVKNLTIEAETVAGEKAAFWNEHKRLARTENTWLNQVKRVKMILHEALVRRGEKKFKSALFTVTIQATAKTYKMQISVPFVPFEYRKNELDTAAVKRDIELGLLYVKEDGRVFMKGKKKDVNTGIVYSGGEALVIR